MKTRTRLIVGIAAAGAFAFGGFALAQSGPRHGPGMHGMQAQMHGKGGMHHGSGHGDSQAGHGKEAAKGDTSASSLAFGAVNEKMHRDMAIEFSGDADLDFARGMIPHHQGAVDMAKIVLVFGKDAEIRKLAEDIVKSQEAEIAFMRAWLNKQGK